MDPSNGSVIVHKFGGSSLADAACFRRVAGIIRARPEPRRAVVVSAMAGVTDALVRAVELAGERSDEYRAVLDELRHRHARTITALVPMPSAEALLTALDADLSDIADILHATTLLRGYSRDALELVSGFGEVWAARTLAAHLAAEGVPASWLDARDVLTVSSDGPVPAVAWDATRERLGVWLERASPAAMLVVTGFVAATADGRATTLGRNGSDFSASIFAALFDACEIHIWTDVDGVMSANPRFVPDAITLPALSYDEAMELAYFGAKVVHPSTMAPAVERGLPIFIRNTFRPELPGTRIHVADSPEFGVKGLATVESVALLNVEGTGMIGVPGMAQRLFGALRDEDVSVILISQASSEHSICFAVRESV
ncbi:MAG: aspartate kinase, partial [Longimicrobiales bacterium]